MSATYQDTRWGCPFKPGDALVAHDTRGVMLTPCREYTAIACRGARYAENGFRYSPDVSVVDDEGELVVVHTERFHLKVNND